MMETRTNVRWRRPACDIYESSTGIEIFADVPGARRQDLSIAASGDELTIETQLPEESAAAELPRYRRKFRLPAHVDHNAIRARLQDGVLQLTLPIADPAEAQTIEIEE
jgi:HSP20 family molecular chaperone IbpA